MPCFIHERIDVQLSADGTAPAGFTWQGRRYTVAGVAACWKAIGLWWDDDGERTYFRVVATTESKVESGKWKVGGCNAQGPTPTSGIYELCYDHESGRWFLETVVD
jgi:hypothetical protein